MVNHSSAYWRRELVAMVFVPQMSKRRGYFRGTLTFEFESLQLCDSLHPN